MLARRHRPWLGLLGVCAPAVESVLGGMQKNAKMRVTLAERGRATLLLAVKTPPLTCGIDPSRKMPLLLQSRRKNKRNITKEE